MAELTVCKSVVFEVSYMRVHAVPLTSIPEPITRTDNQALFLTRPNGWFKT